MPHPMNNWRPKHSSALAMFQLGCWLEDTAVVLRTLSLRLDARIGANKLASGDGRLLGQMSAHELRDIGLSRADPAPLRDDWFVQCHEIARVTGTLFP